MWADKKALACLARLLAVAGCGLLLVAAFCGAGLDFMHQVECSPLPYAQHITQAAVEVDSTPFFSAAGNRRPFDAEAAPTPLPGQPRPTVYRWAAAGAGAALHIGAANTLPAFALGIIVAGLAAALFFALRAASIRSIARLGRQVENVESKGNINLDKLGGGRELQALAQSINQMLDNMNQASVSLQVLRNIMDCMDVLVYVTDPVTDELLFVNEQMYRHYAVESDPIGKVCWASFYGNKEFYPQQNGRCHYCPVEHLLQHPDEVIVTEGRSKMTNRWYRNTNRLIRWNDGRLVHMHHRIDINELKETQASTLRRVEQQELMSNISQSFISSGNIGDTITDVLRMTGEFLQIDCIMVGRRSAEKETLEFIHRWFAAGPPATDPEMQALFYRGQPFYDALVRQGMLYIAHADVSRSDSFRHLGRFGVKSFIAIPLLISGEVWGMLYAAHCADIREWTRSDVHLMRLLGSIISGALTRSLTEEQLAKMSVLVNSSPDYVTYIDGDGRFEYINPGALTMTGYTHEELWEGGLELLFSGENARRIREEFIPRIAREGSYTFALPIIRKDGEVRTLSFSSFALEYHGFGIGTIASDVTEKLRLEQELLAAKELAEEANRAKSEFLSRMSHEIRTPMNAIIGMTGIAQNSHEMQKKDYCLARIDEASTHLLGVINDILDMSKIEAQKFELSLSEFSLEKMLIRLINVMSVKVDEKRQNLLVELPPDLPEYIVGDEQRLAQVITNLLSNAVKFTPDCGTITLTVGLEEAAEDGACTLRVEVEDNGIGISEEQRPRLFQSFEQADGSIARKFGGTGLGLAISKKIVELMGGTIQVNSTPGEGSTFTFTAKVRRVERQKRSQLRPSVTWQELNLLVVDGSADVQAYFIAFARTHRLRCRAVSSAGEALSVLDSGGFHIIFVDWKLPEMADMALIRQIKRKAGDSALIVMISIAEWNDIEEAARQAGADRFLQKPLFSSLLVDCINDCLGNRPKPENESGEQEDYRGRFAGYRILLAEDIEVNREIVMTMLEETGVNIDFAVNGAEACAMFSARADDYDMIFMDMHMPEMDGLEATRRIRAMQLPRAGEIPIIAMTANVFREDIERCLAAGMNGHLGKPIDIAEIYRTMARYLRG